METVHFSPEQVLRDSSQHQQDVIDDVGQAKHLLQKGDLAALELLAYLRKVNLGSGQLSELRSHITNTASLTEHQKRKLTLAVLVMQLPAFVFRKVLWAHNIDFSSKPAFLEELPMIRLMH